MKIIHPARYIDISVQQYEDSARSIHVYNMNTKEGLQVASQLLLPNVLEYTFKDTKKFCIQYWVAANHFRFQDCVVSYRSKN